MIENIKLPKLKTFFKKVFFVWGIICAIGLVLLIVKTTAQLTPREKINEATNEDVEFVLNWTGLGSDRIQEVNNSYSSLMSFTGDHLEAYAIKISGVSLEELNKTSDFGTQWYRGDKLPQHIADAVSDTRTWKREINWFPAEEEIRTESIYVWSESVHYSGSRVTAYRIILIRPADNMVFYISTKQ